MKSLLLVLITLVILVNIDNSFAIESDFEIEYNILPEKIHEDDMILLEVYMIEGGKVILDKIQDLKIESLDTSIIEIIDFEETHEYKILIKLKAMSEGETILYVFTEGTQAVEIPITINGNNIPKGVSLDIFPDTFELDKNNQGILSVLLTDENGDITRADKDYQINISTTKQGIISFNDHTIIIPKGDFGFKQDFTVINNGDITVTVKTNDMEDSELVTVDAVTEREVVLSVIPEDISSSNTSIGHMIAQLSSGGNLIKATKDMTVSFEIESSSDAETVNTSSPSNTLNPTGYFQIKKGQTYGHTVFSIQKGETDEYTVTATIQNPLTIVEETFETIDVELYGDEQIKFEPISILADGKKQLVGVLYLQDVNDHPVTANKDIVVTFTTSDKSISIENSIIKKGYESALVFGNMGYFIPIDTEIIPNFKNSEVMELDIQGFDEASISLMTHMHTEHFLKGEEHWITIYMEAAGELFEIPDNQHFKISDSKIFQIDKDRIETYPYFILVPITAIDTGDEDLVISSDTFETSVSLSSTISKPDSLEIKYSDNLFTGIKDTFTIQILDAQGLPVKINEDVEIKIFSSDPSIINFPKNITVSQKSSFITLDIIPEDSGEVEISLVSKGLPIVTEEITIEDITPSIQITSADIIGEGESFIVSILAQQNGIPLKNANIIWELEGGVTTIIEEKTGPTGEALASIISTSDKLVKISATIDNGPFQSAYASKIIRVNATIEIPITESDESFKKPSIEGIDPIMIIIPALIGGVIIYMKKKKSK